MMNEQVTDIKNASFYFLRGMSCKESKLRWVDRTNRFFVLQHCSHASYGTRASGVSNCPSYFLLLDIKENNTEYDYMYGDLNLEYIEKFEGRWNKKLQKKCQGIVSLLLKEKED